MHPPAAATTWSARDATWSVVIVGISAAPDQADALKWWGRAYLAVVLPFIRDGPTSTLRRTTRTGGACRRPTARPTSVSARYDPQNLFRGTQNIPPAAA